MPRTSLRTWIVAIGLACSVAPHLFADDWPQWRGPTRDGVWRETGIIEKFDKPKLDWLWRAEISSGYSGPTVANGKVYVTDRVVSPNQLERVHCFDAKSGNQVWTHSYECPYRDVSYDAGPRASVLINDGRAYSLGTMGDFICFNAADGKILWQKNIVKDFKVEMPVWGMSASPLVEGDLIILQVGGEPDACLVAFDKRTGATKWHAVNDKASYAAPIVIDQAGKRIVVAYTGNHVVGVDAGTGKEYWKHPFPPRKMVMGISTPVVSDDMLFLTNFFDGSLMLRLKKDTTGVEELWKRAGADEKDTDALHSIISTPILRDGHIYGVDSYGELRCLNTRTGDRVWESRDAVPRARWATIHFVENKGQTWMFNERGELIIGQLSPGGYKELSRAKLLDPTLDQLREREGVCWSHPAFAMKKVFARNDRELVCADLAAP